MLVGSRGYPLLTMVNGPLMAWRSWPDSYRSRPVRAAVNTSVPWCCSPFRALPGASSAWPLSGWTRPLLPPTRLLPDPGTDGFCQGRLCVYINHAPLTGSGCPTVTDGLDRFRESQILLRRVGGRPPTFPPAYGRREAELHRSRTVSLGIGPILAGKGADPGVMVALVFPRGIAATPVTRCGGQAPGHPVGDGCGAVLSWRR